MSALAEDDLPKKKSGVTLRLLEPMSIGELEEYTTWLHAEIARVAAEIEKKKAAQKAADSIFKKAD